MIHKPVRKGEKKPNKPNKQTLEAGLWQLLSVTFPSPDWAMSKSAGAG